MSDISADVFAEWRVVPENVVPLPVSSFETMKNESLLCFCATRFTAVATLRE